MISPTGPELTREGAPHVIGPVTIRLENVAVRYRAPEERLRSFKEYAIRRIQRRVRYSDFYALDGINLEVHAGEIFGLVGRNGAGKSTLLKVISRVLVPTRGRVYLAGLVAPLLELSAGFHPELTGRENIVLNATLLGRTHREVDEEMDRIIEFADLGRFIDAPLRTYSSGMGARLGFAVATAWQPEILLVDEVLSVGDEAFQTKCLDRMQSFRDAGTTIILVTHNLGTVRTMCARAAWLDHGRIRSLGPALDVVSEYKAS